MHTATPAPPPATIRPPAPNQSRFFFESAALSARGPNPREVTSFSGVEEISRPYEYDVRLVSDDPAIDLDAVLGRPARLLLRRGAGAPLPIHGVVAAFRQGGRAAGRHAYDAVLVPRLWLLSLSFQSRVFQQLRADEIVAEVLRQAGFTSRDFRFDLRAPLPQREYCVQYQETDLAFVQRLLEHEGVYYFFEQHAGGYEVVVFTDDRAASPDVPGGARAVEYHASAGLADDAETVSELAVRRQLVSGRVVLKDYNYRTPETPLLVEAQQDGTLPGTFYEYGAHFKTAAEGERLARVRDEEHRAARHVVAGATDCTAFRAGHVFALAGHFRDDLNVDYVVTRVEHEGWQAPGFGVGVGANGDAAASPPYRSRFAAIPAAVQYRPPRTTPVPRLAGIITARLETAGGDYAYVDEQGRYRVKLPFDLSDRGSGTASRAVRMAQSYSGPGYGIHFPNRAGTEMVLAFVNGDVDRPIGLSTVPNPSNGSPAVAANKAQHVIRTASGNELTFDDTIGGERVFLNGTKDWTIRIAHDKAQTVGNNETSSVGANQSLAVGANRDKTVGGNQTETVEGNKTITVAGAHAERIGASMTQTIGASASETIAIAKTLSIGAAYQVSVGGVMSESVGAAKMEQIGGAKIVGVGLDSSETVGMSKSVQAGTSISETAGEDFTVDAGKKVGITAGDDATVSSGKKVIVTAADELVLKCGSASITLKQSGDIVIRGAKITVQGSSDVVVKGSRIAKN